jgi:NAD(P)-dependent dehydrogenase (short-subunit alcohol dehydrogenase family)
VGVVAIMTKVAAVEYAQYGIRVNCLHPGPVLTPMMARALDPATQAAVSAAVPLGRMADPSEVSYAVLFWPAMNPRM